MYCACMSLQKIWNIEHHQHGGIFRIDKDVDPDDILNLTEFGMFVSVCSTFQPIEKWNNYHPYMALMRSYISESISSRLEHIVSLIIINKNMKFIWFDVYSYFFTFEWNFRLLFFATIVSISNQHMYHPTSLAYQRQQSSWTHKHSFHKQNTHTIPIQARQSVKRLLPVALNEHVILIIWRLFMMAFAKLHTQNKCATDPVWLLGLGRFKSSCRCSRTAHAHSLKPV